MHQVRDKVGPRDRRRAKGNEESEEKVREDYMELLEKMFSRGYVIIYRSAKKKRLASYNPFSDTMISEAVDLIQRELENGGESEEKV